MLLARSLALPYAPAPAASTRPPCLPSRTPAPWPALGTLLGRIIPEAGARAWNRSSLPASEGTDPPDTCIWDFWPLELWIMHFCCLSSLVGGTSWWRLEPTEHQRSP